MKGVELSKLVITITCTVIMVQTGGCFIFKDLLLCDQSSLDIICPNETLISEVNITSPKLTPDDNVCSKSGFDTRHISFNEEVGAQCIGHRSCRISSTDIEVTHISDQTRKLNISYSCFYRGFWSVERRFICANLMQTIQCKSEGRIHIAVAYIMDIENIESACFPKQDSRCAKIIENKIIEICDWKKDCVMIEDQDIRSDFNTCIRIPKYVYVSFSCSADAKRSSPQSKNLISKILGIIFGVSAGIVLVALLSLVLVRRLKAKGISISLTVTYKTTDHRKPSSVSVIEDIQDNYTSLDPTREVSYYMKLDNAKPDFSVSKDNIYMDVL